MYECRFYRGDYFHRQKCANDDNATLYIEQHFNSDYKGVGNYSCALITYNASETSKKFASKYAELVAQAFHLESHKVVVLKKGGRGYYNLVHTKMPAILLEPLFISNKDHVKMILEENGVDKLADILSYLIQDMFGEGLIAFSVGHKYKRTKPADRGAVFRGKPEYTEADVAEWVLWKTKCKIERG